MPQPDIAFAYAGLGEWDCAFVWLEKAYERRKGALVFLKPTAPFIPGLSADSQVTDLLRRIGLPQ